MEISGGRGTISASGLCPWGQFLLVDYVRGDKICGDRICSDNGSFDYASKITPIAKGVGNMQLHACILIEVTRYHNNNNLH